MRDLREFRDWWNGISSSTINESTEKIAFYAWVAATRECSSKVTFFEILRWLLDRIEKNDHGCLNGNCEHKTVNECRQALWFDYVNSAAESE